MKLNVDMDIINIKAVYYIALWKCT